MGRTKATGKVEKRRKKEEAKPTESDWSYSKCSRNDLLHLAKEGLLQEQHLVWWCSSFSEPYPRKNVDEAVLFQHFIERGLALPTSNFFRGLLYNYGLQLHHLNPNSIAHIAIFVHLCEAFLGIEPHFTLFCYLFRLKPQTSEERQCGRTNLNYTGSSMRVHSRGLQRASNGIIPWPVG
jgi:hypothetical protein